MDKTLAYGGRRSIPALDDTVAATGAAPARSLAVPTAGVRSTVLPRVERKEGAQRVVVEEKPRYEELRRLGAGGQAEVALTRDHDIGRQVALKRLLPEHEDEASVLRFADEIRTIGQLEHPNIVPIHDVGVDADGRYFFVMRYIEGETLDSIIEKLRAGDPAYLSRYTPEYRMQICNEILRGVEHAHSLGILHRDLKPGNVMVGSLGEAVVMDWGLAKRSDGGELSPPPSSVENASSRLFETQAGALMGTPAYMAPEQAAGQPVDVRSDVYSLAVTFYEFFTLRHPRADCTSVAEMIASVVEAPIEMTQVFGDFTAAGAPAAVAHFVRHGLARDPAERYPSVAAMRERLDLVRDGHAPIECHVTFTTRVLGKVTRAANHHPWILAAALGATAISAIAGVVQLARALF